MDNKIDVAKLLRNERQKRVSSLERLPRERPSEPQPPVFKPKQKER